MKAIDLPTGVRARPLLLAGGLLVLLVGGCETGFAPDTGADAPAPASPPRIDVIVPAVADRLRLAPLHAVELEGFLGRRVAANASNRLPHIPTELLLDGFAQRPLEYWTGERTGKWIDAAALAWMHTGDPELRRKLDQVVAGVVASQLPDGYLGTATEEERWEEWDVWIHKYVLLGLLRYHEATGDEAALAAARRAADLILSTFGPGGRSILEAGAHMGMAATSILEPMVLLYRRTGDGRYLDFAHHLVASWDEAGGPRILRTLEETGSVLRTANAKAYEMISNLIGLCELYRTTGDARLLEPVLVAWEDIRANQIYVTGGGAVGEHWAEPHQHPNTVGDRINENCVTVSWLQLTAQLLRLTGEPRYADALEHSLYNALLAAQSDDGASWCYYTPLAGTKPFTEAVHCCSSSGPRALGLAPSLAFQTGDEGVYVALYEAGRASLSTPGGQELLIEVAGGYPGSGDATLTLSLRREEAFTVTLRVPAWTTAAQVTVAGERQDTAGSPGSWLRLERRWRDGDRIELSLDPAPRLVAGRGSNQGRLAAMVGPLVLALDARDNPDLATAPDATGLAVEPTGGPWTPRLHALPPEHAEWPGQRLVHASGFRAGGSGADGARAPIDLVLRDYATAGASGAPFAVWLLAPGADPGVAPSRIFGAPGRTSAGSPQTDAYLTICPYCPVGLLATILNDRRPFSSLARSGAADAAAQTSLTDGDPKSLAIAFAGKDDSRAWFEVTAEAPVEATRIEVVHGTTNVDGGWFDAREGKPEVLVRDESGAWSSAGVLAEYPHTTGADPAGLAGGRTFVVRLDPPRRITGVRVAGAPSAGDRSGPAMAQGRPIPERWRSSEAFASLGEIRVH